MLLDLEKIYDDAYLDKIFHLNFTISETAL